MAPGNEVLMNRERAIEIIEGAVGCWEAVWHEWPDKSLEAMLYYVILHSRKDDANRLHKEVFGVEP